MGFFNSGSDEGKGPVGQAVLRDGWTRASNSLTWYYASSTKSPCGSLAPGPLIVVRRLIKGATKKHCTVCSDSGEGVSANMPIYCAKEYCERSKRTLVVVL